MSFQQALNAILGALELGGFPYALVGSVASSIYGVPRSTLDIDMLVGLSSPDVPRFVALLQKDFYIDEIAIETAIEYQRSFNIIYQPYILKIDIFPVPSTHPDLLRSHRTSAEVFGHAGEISVLSPEDVILSKLAWYEQGGRQSQNQWNDIQGVLNARADLLDWTYLEDQAQHRGLSALLRQARSA